MSITLKAVNVTPARGTPRRAALPVVALHNRPRCAIVFTRRGAQLSLSLPPSLSFSLSLFLSLSLSLSLSLPLSLSLSPSPL